MKSANPTFREGPETLNSGVPVNVIGVYWDQGLRNVPGGLGVT